MKTDISTYRVYYEDTDAGGVVYYANFLKFAERGRTDFLRKSGFDHFRLAQEQKLFFVVRKVDMEYNSPGRLDDLITVETIITHVGKSSVDMSQVFTNQNGLKLGTANVQIVCVSNAGDKIKSAAMPQEIAEFFKA